MALGGYVSRTNALNLDHSKVVFRKNTYQRSPIDGTHSKGILKVRGFQKYLKVEDPYRGLL